MVKITPSEVWLLDPIRTYPIVIDPTVSTSLDYQNIKDTYLYNGDQDNYVRHRAHVLRIGSNNRAGVKSSPVRSLVNFTLPNLNAGDQVVGAYLNICTYPKTGEWTPSPNEMQIDVHKVTSPWSDDTANWNNMSNNYEKTITDYIKYKFDYNNQFKFYDFNITNIVKDWYVTGQNYGVMLKDHIETYNYPYSDAYFVSSNTHADYTKRKTSSIYSV